MQTRKTEFETNEAEAYKHCSGLYPTRRCNNESINILDKKQLGIKLSDINRRMMNKHYVSDLGMTCLSICEARTTALDLIYISFQSVSWEILDSFGTDGLQK